MSSMLGAMEDFGMDTISLAGHLEAKLKAIKEAGFSHIKVERKYRFRDADQDGFMLFIASKS